jgi:branched-chain amino acid transport system substrate-binding protein
LRDTWAIEAMMGEAHKRKLGRIGMLMPNTGWGRSSLKAAEAYAKAHPQTKLVDALWYNWGDKSLMAKYRELLQKGAQTIVLVANEGEGSILVKEIAQLPANERLPILSHWGITGGQFVKLAGEALTKVDLSAVQTYSFIDDKSPAAQRVLAALKDKYGVADARKVEAPVGVAHAYDLVHLLAQAINQAGRADREAVRTALENLKEHKGLVRHYRPPFTASRHEALALDNVFLARYEADGALVRAGKR